MSASPDLLLELDSSVPGHAEPGVAKGVLRSGASKHAIGMDTGIDEKALEIVHRVFLRDPQSRPGVVVFAGIDHGVGCSQICAGVAGALAGSYAGRVCLVEANFHTPGLPDMFRTTNHHGLADALQSDAPIRSFARPVHEEKVWLLSAGALTESSSSLLNSQAMQQRVAELRRSFEFVIIDTPPLKRYADAMAVAQYANGVVLILEAGATRRETASASASTLRSAGIPILAAVLNKRTFPIPQPLYDRM